MRNIIIKLEFVYPYKHQLFAFKIDGCINRFFKLHEVESTYIYKDLSEYDKKVRFNTITYIKDDFFTDNELLKIGISKINYNIDLKSLINFHKEYKPEVGNLLNDIQEFLI